MLCNKDAGKLLGRYISTVRTYTYIVVEETPGKNILGYLYHTLRGFLTFI